MPTTFNIKRTEDTVISSELTLFDKLGEWSHSPKEIRRATTDGDGRTVAAWNAERHATGGVRCSLSYAPPHGRCSAGRSSSGRWRTRCNSIERPTRRT